MYSYTNQPVHSLLTSVPPYVMPTVFNRIFAAAIDLLCFSLTLGILGEILHSIFGLGSIIAEPGGMLTFILFLVVRSLFMYVFSTTPGLSLYGLRAVSSVDLCPPPLKSLLFRVPFQCLGLLVFTLIFYRQRMTVYDMICNVTYIPEYLLKLENNLSGQKL